MICYTRKSELRMRSYDMMKNAKKLGFLREKSTERSRSRLDRGTVVARNPMIADRSWSLSHRSLGRPGLRGRGRRAQGRRPELRGRRGGERRPARERRHAGVGGALLRPGRRRGGPALGLAGPRSGGEVGLARETGGSC